MDDIQITEIAVDGYAIAAFVIYLSSIIGIGIYASRYSSRGIAEFFVGGRSMNRLIVALSAVVSGRSAWLLLGVTGMAYVMGASAVWAVVGYIVVELFLFLYFARRIRNFSGAYDCVTVPDFFAARFRDESGVLRILMSVIILIFMIGYVSAQFVAGGKAFASGFDVTNQTGIIFTAIIVLVYTILGGFLAVSLTDMVQAIFMLLALVLLPVIIIIQSGGWEFIAMQLSQIDPTLIDPVALSAGVLVGFLGIGLGAPGNPHIIARYMSIDDSRQLRWVAVTGTIWNVLMAWGALIIGLAGRVIIPEVDLLPAGDTENLYPVLARMFLPSIIFGAIVASIFAAIMSTADSQLLVAASAVVRDVYEKIICKGKDVPQETLVLYSRIVVALLVVVSLLFGLIAENLVFWLVLFAWAGLGAALGPTTILALYWKKTTKEGVIAGMLTGALVTIVWYLVPQLNALIYELIPGFIAGGVMTVAISLFTKTPEDYEKLFEAMKQDSNS